MDDELVNPADCGNDLDEDAIVDLFNEFTRGDMMIDEMLLHPKIAAEFCVLVRFRCRRKELSDHAILSVVWNRAGESGDLAIFGVPALEPARDLNRREAS